MRNRFSQVKKPGTTSGITNYILPVAGFILVIALFFYGMNSINKTNTAEQLRSAENAVVKATIQCYALEGQYPPNPKYLEKHYGLSVDRTKYIIHYEFIGSNIMPDVRVVPIDF